MKFFRLQTLLFMSALGLASLAALADETALVRNGPLLNSILDLAESTPPLKLHLAELAKQKTTCNMKVCGPELRDLQAKVAALIPFSNSKKTQIVLSQIATEMNADLMDDPSDILFSYQMTYWYRVVDRVEAQLQALASSDRSAVSLCANQVVAERSAIQSAKAAIWKSIEITNKSIAKAKMAQFKTGQFGISHAVRSSEIADLLTQVQGKLKSNEVAVLVEQARINTVYINKLTTSALLVYPVRIVNVFSQLKEELKVILLEFDPTAEEILEINQL